MNNILKFVKEHYETLPESSFNDKKLIIVKEISNEDYGWGNHSYSGIGIDKDGIVFYCYSSGCSCSGSCDANVSELHDKKTGKLLKVNPENECDVLPEECPSIQELEKFKVNFSDY